MRRVPRLLVVPLILLGVAGVARATDIPIAGLKLIVVDKTVAASSAKAVFVAKDGAITKGPGTDPAQISATLDIAYDAVRGSFDMPQGANWLVNSASVGKYVNKNAPTGGAAKVSVIKPFFLVKVVGKSLGDTPLDISSAPTGMVYVADTIVNGGDTIRLCTQFAFGGCAHKLIAGGTGYKLVCKQGSGGDPACTAAGPATTTTTTSSSSTSSTTSSSITSPSTSTTTTTITTTTTTSTTLYCGGDSNYVGLFHCPDCAIANFHRPHPVVDCTSDSDCPSSAPFCASLDLSCGDCAFVGYRSCVAACQ
jgi:hypothetical protein